MSFFDTFEEHSGELFLIAGPCVIESEKHAIGMGEAIARITSRLRIPYVFKASYDKANRSSNSSFRGIGTEEGLRVLSRIRSEIAIPVLTDVHESVDVARVAESVDVIQIPAFLCRQTDLLQSAAETGLTVNVKKGQFLSPWEVGNIITKLEASGCRKILITERGTSFGYNNLVVDMRSFPICLLYTSDAADER